MAIFNVALEIELEAETPLNAAKMMQSWLEDGTSWVYYVQNSETKEIFTVDLNEEDNNSVTPNNHYQSVIVK